MKSLISLKIIMMIITTGILFSCKNNQDGYSDELNTAVNPSDSMKTPSDNDAGVRSVGPGTNESPTTTTKNNPQGSGTNSSGEGSTGTTANDNTNSQSSGSSTSGKGSGPGESPKDGATYTNYSKAKNDSLSTNTQSTNQKKTK
ncbi:hypothetical protein [Flavobacterium sp. 1355]|jgi:hypothetical protein|uniref:hypothetical protein n=1 Tax=Flavobacterium sp. 1355 TaxID=2806571 RepID=UPI001AE2F575|nr:hypothetical protein [Flavobacterium sp. 1355]MBP1222424.1 hypothetical protein [Flavobacterium sp. 1355]